MVKRMIYDAIEDDHDDVGDQEEEDEDVDHPGAVVLPLPPVVWPAHHHRVRLHASQPRRLHEEKVKVKTIKIFWKVEGATKKICWERKTFL